MATHTWPAMLGSLIAARNLSEDDTAWAMDQIMSGVATTAQIAGFAVALRAKGETPDEIAGMARTMLAHAKRVSLDIGRSTSSAPVGTRPAPSTSPRWQRWSRQRQAYRW